MAEPRLAGSGHEVIETAIAVHPMHRIDRSTCELVEIVHPMTEVTTRPPLAPGLVRQRTSRIDCGRAQSPYP